MSSLAQMEDNLSYMKDFVPLNAHEQAVIARAQQALNEDRSIPCTACHYCVSHCPQGLDIPRLIALYNEHLLTVEDGGMAFIAPMALMAIPQGEAPRFLPALPKL